MKCTAVTAICLVVMSVCVSVPRRIPILLHGPTYKLGEWQGVPLVVHYWADLQSVHGFHCSENVVPNAKCQRVPVLALCLLVFVMIMTTMILVIITIIIIIVIIIINQTESTKNCIKTANIMQHTSYTRYIIRKKLSGICNIPSLLVSSSNNHTAQQCNSKLLLIDTKTCHILRISMTVLNTTTTRWCSVEHISPSRRCYC